MSLAIVTYHAVEAGPPPLCVDPSLFARHLDELAELHLRTLTVTEVATALGAGSLPERAIALTFDDGLQSVFDNAVPALLERGLTATVFCVANHLGGRTDWRTQPADLRSWHVADAAALRDAAAAGIEIGSHGLEHEPVHAADAGMLRRELADSRRRLEDELGASVTSFAFPYGTTSPAAREALVEAGYEAACAGGMELVRAGADPFALPRIDAHYLRRPALLRAAATGSAGLYLSVRRTGGRARRLLRKDYAL